MNADSVIDVRELSRAFGDLTAVDKISFSVRKGEVFGLVGPDGAGKTTTLRMLCTLMHPTGGDASVAGFDIRGSADPIKDRIGYMAQKFGMYSDLTVEENMQFYADLFGVSLDGVADPLLKMTRMEPFRDRAAGKLSGGMKQKLALMCALLHKPEILFLDEPTNGVDPVSRRDFWTILYQLVKEGMTVFVTTAYLDEAERCDRVALMDRGRIIRLDSPKALREGLPLVCYEVRCDDTRTARERLRERPEVISADLAGSALHVFTRHEADVAEWLEGMPGLHVRRILPALEDVFIATIREQRRDAA